MTGTDSIYQAITDRIIKKIEAGTIPWQKPWTAAAGVPRNIVSKKPYQGVNVLILSTTEFSSPWWITFKQAKELGGNISKGSKSEIIVFFKRYEKTDGNGEFVYDENGRQRIGFVLRYSRVFNLEQTEGIKSPQGDLPSLEATINDGDTGAIAKAKAIVESARLCPITNGGSLPFYNPSRDRIVMPPIRAFKSLAAYYHTLFHEMTHATAHPSRLDRKSDNRGESYAAEELVAEIGASFLSNTAGILSEIEFENSAAYLAGWLKALKDDRKLIVHAASAAQKAADFILGSVLAPTVPAEDGQDSTQANLAAV
jgi:antirestriction protein ArdC